jgi:hypothetical protein
LAQLPAAAFQPLLERGFTGALGGSELHVLQDARTVLVLAEYSKHEAGL